MEELPINSEITLRTIEDTDETCIDCFFDELSRDMYTNCCTRIKCSKTERKDGKSVKFKLVEK